MKSIILTLVTEFQSHVNQAKQLAALVKEDLGANWLISGIERYHKFEDSYKIELRQILEQTDQPVINNLMIFEANKIISPWLVYADDSESTIELIFNKNESTKNRRPAYLVIKWGHLQIIE